MSAVEEEQREKLSRQLIVNSSNYEGRKVAEELQDNENFDIEQTNGLDKKESSTDKIKKDGSSCISSGDICRICHMGGYPSVIGNPPMWEWANERNRTAAAATNNPPRHNASSLSTLSSSYAYLGPLISACKCRGTVGLVHTECLERWLTESGHTRCELCAHKYSTKRVPRHGIFRSVVIWFSTVIATRQMLLDILYLIATTPLALFSCYVCAIALKMIVESGFQDIPWMIVAMLPTCSLTIVAYWGWLITLGRYISRLHGRRWHRFWRNNYVVRLVPEAPNLPIQHDMRDVVVESMEYYPAIRIENYENHDNIIERSSPDEESEDFLQVLL